MTVLVVNVFAPFEFKTHLAVGYIALVAPAQAEMCIQAADPAARAGVDALKIRHQDRLWWHCAQTTTRQDPSGSCDPFQ